MNVPPVQAKARLLMDVKATKTIAITVAAYCLCYGPVIAYAVFGLQEENLADTWFGFYAWYSLYISSALNPIICYVRTSRYRAAFKQFLKDPFGSSDFKEKPNGRGSGEKCHDKVRANKRNGERVESVEAFQVERDENEITQTYSGKPNNDGMEAYRPIFPLTIKLVMAVNSKKERHKRQYYPCQKSQVQNSSQGKVEETE